MQYFISFSNIVRNDSIYFFSTVLSGINKVKYEEEGMLSIFCKKVQHSFCICIVKGVRDRCSVQLQKIIQQTNPMKKRIYVLLRDFLACSWASRVKSSSVFRN
jgi:hypothetical protein